MPVVERFTAREILDSRGRPTVEAACILKEGIRGCASVPSGISTGRAEALELRDGDPKRYGGLGCRKAVANVNGNINQAFRGRRFANQCELDNALIELDGTPTKSRLGANAILAASLAFARGAAEQLNLPLWGWFAAMVGHQPENIPRLTINLFSGGKHAGQPLSIQDVLIVPVAAKTIEESLAVAFDVYASAAKLLLARYGMRLLRADEGGLAPPCNTPEEMIELAIESIRSAGYQPGSQVAVAADVAATQFHTGEGYRLGNEILTSDAMIHRIGQWVDSYPIVSVEDGLAEDDWSSWPILLKAIGDRALVLGDDLLCTNPMRIQRAVTTRSCNALLLKLNQIGTVTEAAEAHRLAREASWAVTVSVRSGDTEDNWAADLALGWGADYFKGGSITQSERLAKYNRLLEIEQETDLPLATEPLRRP